MRNTAAVAVLTSFLAVAAQAQEVTEPKTGVKFAEKLDGMSLLGTSVRTRTMLKVKVYAVGLYVADEALKGPLASAKSTPTSPAFYQGVVQGDFPKQITMKFVRDVTKDQLDGAWRESLEGADDAYLGQFLSAFGDTKSGREYTLRWKPGTGLQVAYQGAVRGTIDNQKFAGQVFSIWLGPDPIQGDIKKALVARAAQAP